MNSKHKKLLKIKELSVERHEHEMKTVFYWENCGSNQSRNLFIARGIAPDILLLHFSFFFFPM